MDFSFNANTFRDLFHSTVAVYLKDEAMTNEEPKNETLNSPYNLLAAMDQAIDVMVRAEASRNDVNEPDVNKPAQNNISAKNIGMLEEKDITRIGQYALGSLEGMLAFVENKTGEQSRDLLRFSLPLSLWVARHGGKLSHIDMLVNSLAGYANEVSESQSLIELSGIFKELIEACNDDIRRDQEQTNEMRPWRILNLNYGIVATRSHQPELIEQAYDALVKNLPQDAREFFKEGLHQMDVVGYPDEVRVVVERYNKMWGSESVLH